MKDCFWKDFPEEWLPGHAFCRIYTVTSGFLDLLCSTMSARLLLRAFTALSVLYEKNLSPNSYSEGLLFQRGAYVSFMSLLSHISWQAILSQPNELGSIPLQ